MSSPRKTGADRRVYDQNYRRSEKGRISKLSYCARRRKAMGRSPRISFGRPVRITEKHSNKSICLTVDQFVAMDESQDFCCAICGGEMNPPHVDHCHDSSRIRGLLCKNCNSGIGLLGDDPARLNAAAVYLSA